MKPHGPIKPRPDIVGVLGIRRAYEIATGQSTASCTERKGRLRVSCPSWDHADEHPSASLNLNMNAFYCFSCCKGGGVLDLPIVAGHAVDRASAATWFAERTR